MLKFTLRVAQQYSKNNQLNKAKPERIFFRGGKQQSSMDQDEPFSEKEPNSQQQQQQQQSQSSQQQSKQTQRNQQQQEKQLFLKTIEQDERISQEKINSLLHLQDSPKKYLNLINAYSQLNQTNQIIKLYEQYVDKFPQKAEASVTEAFINALSVNYQNNPNQNYLLIQKLLKPNMSLQVHQNVFALIFRLRLLPHEKCKELDRLPSKELQDVSLFGLIFTDQNYVEYPEYFTYNLEVFLKYFTSFAQNFKTKKNYEHLPNLKNIFRIAVQETIKNNPESDPAFMIFELISEMQLNQQQYLDQQDLINLMVHYTTIEKKLEIISKIARKYKGNDLIIRFQDGLKELDKQGKQNKCFKDANHLEKSYMKLSRPVNVAVLELYLVFAERLEKWDIIADIYMKYNQLISSQDKDKSYLVYQKALNMVLALDGSNNAVVIQLIYQVYKMSLIQEQNRSKTQMNKLEYNLYQIKAQIREGQYQSAFNIFKSHVIDEVLLKFQREKITRFLGKYVQNYEVNADHTYNPQEYKRRMKRVFDFVNPLSPKQLMKFYNEDQTDNLLIEAITEHEDIFEYWDKKLYEKSFSELRVLIVNNFFDYKKLVHPIDENLIRMREIFLNYEYYMQEEKKRIIAERKKLRIGQIFETISSEYLSEYTAEEVMKDVYKNFTNEELEEGLWQGDKEEFPEIEEVRSMQANFLKLDSSSQSLIYQEEPVAEIEQISSEQLGLEVPEEVTEAAVDEAEEVQREAGIEQEPEVAHEMSGKEYEEYVQSPEGKKAILRETYQMAITDDDMIDRPTDLSLWKTQSDPLESIFIDTGKRIYKSEFEEMRAMYHHPYKYYDHYINLQPANYQEQIWDLVAWGLKYKEPFAIRLGEHYCHHVGVKMPIYLSKAVASFYKYEMGYGDCPIRQKWTKTYKVAGSFDISKVYEPIDNAFISDQELLTLHNMEMSSLHKGLARSYLRTSHSYSRYFRYGITIKDIAKSYSQY